MWKTSEHVTGLDNIPLSYMYEMRSGPNRPHHRYRSRRLRHLLLSYRPWVLFLILSAFIAINSLLYRGINRADGRSMDPRSLTVKEKVISIDSWQTEGNVGDTRWDLYIDSPRKFQGLPGSQREKGDSEVSANKASAPLVRYIRRGGGGNNTNADKMPANGIEYDTRRMKTATVAKQVNARFDYALKSDKTQRGRTNTGASRRGSWQNDIAIGRGQINSRNLVHVKSFINQSKVFRAPAKLKNRVSTEASRSFRQSGRRTVKSWTSPKNEDGDGVMFYSRPTWLSERDTEVLRRLTDDPISGFYNFPAQHTGTKLGLGFLIYESEFGGQKTNTVNAVQRCSAQGVTCAVVFSPAEIHRVLAFHLDRVLGFHRTLPTVSRRLTDNLRRQVGLPVDVSFPLMLYEPSLYIDVELSNISKTQLAGCISGDDRTEGLEWCNNVLTDDWSAVALFDFLLQIYHRMDFGCCGLESWERQRRCGNIGGSRGMGCTNSSTGSSTQKIGCSFRLSSQSDKLVLVENLVDLRAPVDKLDVWLLQGLNSFPAHAVSMLREGRLHQMLLQSLFSDNEYWEDQGGRHAMEENLDIIDKRGRIFLQYISS